MEIVGILIIDKGVVWPFVSHTKIATRILESECVVVFQPETDGCLDRFTKNLDTEHIHSIITRMNIYNFVDGTNLGLGVIDGVMIQDLPRSAIDNFLDLPGGFGKNI